MRALQNLISHCGSLKPIRACVPVLNIVKACLKGRPSREWQTIYVSCWSRRSKIHNKKLEKSPCSLKLSSGKYLCTGTRLVPSTHSSACTSCLQLRQLKH